MCSLCDAVALTQFSAVHCTRPYERILVDSCNYFFSDSVRIAVDCYTFESSPRGYKTAAWSVACLSQKCIRCSAK